VRQGVDGHSVILVTSTTLLRLGQTQLVYWPYPKSRATWDGRYHPRAHQSYHMEISNQQTQTHKRILRPRRGKTTPTSSVENYENDNSQQHNGRVLSQSDSTVVMPIEMQAQRAQQETITSQNSTNSKRHKWTREEYSEIMRAYFCATLNPTVTSATDETFQIWRNRNPNLLPKMTAVTLANQRRYITSTKKLTETELNTIKEQVQRESLSSVGTEPTTPDGVTESGDQEEESITERIVINPPPPTTTESLETFTKELKDEIRREWEKVKLLPMREREALQKVQESKEVKMKIKDANHALDEIMREQHEQPTLTELNGLFYATARVLTGKPARRNNKTAGKEKPKWQINIEKRIAAIRRDLSMAAEIQNKNAVGDKKKRLFFRRNQSEAMENIETIKERLKQKLQATSQRLRRCKRKYLFFHQNKLFKQDAKRFDRELGKKPIQVSQPPEKKSWRSFGGTYGRRRNSTMIMQHG